MYNKHEIERACIARKNNQVYTRTVSKRIEMPLNQVIEELQSTSLSELNYAEEKRLLQRLVETIIGKILDVVSTQAYTAGYSNLSTTFKNPESKKEYISDRHHMY